MARIGRPEPNTRIVVWNGGDNDNMKYSDYVVCNVDSDGLLTVDTTGHYDENLRKVVMDGAVKEEYAWIDHVGFDEVVTGGLNNEFNDWDYAEGFKAPKFNESTFTSYIKRMKEEINEEILRKAKEQIAEEDIADEGEEIDLSELSDENLDELISQTHEIDEAVEETKEEVMEEEVVSDIDISDIIEFLNSHRE